MEDNSTSNNLARDQSRWAVIIGATKTPLGFYSLVVLVSEAIMATAIPFADDVRPILVGGMLGILGILIVIVSVFAYVRPEALGGENVSKFVEGGSVNTNLREEMRCQIRSDIDQALEQIEVALHNDEFALFLEAKTGDAKKGYENYPGIFEDSANLQFKAVQAKIDAIISAEIKGHRDFELPITAQEIERLERRLEAIRVALPTDLFRGVFWTYRPITESEWENQKDRRIQFLQRLENHAANGIMELKREFS